MAKTIVTPWEVKGNIDYDKLIQEFGVQKIDATLIKRIEKIIVKKKNILLSTHFLKKRRFSLLTEI